MNRAIFLDRDGVINVDHGYVHKIDDFEFIPGSIEAMKRISDSAFKLIIITSQAGIGRGYYKESDYHGLMEHMHEELEKKEIKVDDVYYCPHSPDAGCSCRKPSVEMVEKAAKKHNIDLKSSYVVGDKTSDVKMGIDAGCTSILVKTGEAGNDGRHDVKPDFIADDLKQAVRWIFDREKDSCFGK